jgi:uracil-DNA glycosylase
MIDLTLDNSWKRYLSSEFSKPYFSKLLSLLDDEVSYSVVYPSIDNIFTAFNLTRFDNIKVVILGQDPYHGKGQAQGLAFSVPNGVLFPPSLRNIFQEYTVDLGYDMPVNGDLTKWADEGVFLLNTVLTVRAGEAHSHKAKGWENFTDAVIQFISDKKENVVFILWGKPAQSKVRLIDESKHLVLKASHPSPLSSYRGFFGSKPFTQTNSYLKKHGITEIDWRLD